MGLPNTLAYYDTAAITAVNSDKNFDSQHHQQTPDLWQEREITDDISIHFFVAANFFSHQE